MARPKKTTKAAPTPPKRRGRPPKAAKTAFESLTVPETLTGTYSFTRPPEPPIEITEAWEAIDLALLRVQRISATLRLTTPWVSAYAEDENETIIMMTELLDGAHAMLVDAIAQIKTYP
jgi:hypothetical protein